MSSEGEEYNVETLLDLKTTEGKEYVLVQWQGFPNTDDNTWEPVESMQENFGDEINVLRAQKAIPAVVRKRRGRQPKPKVPEPPVEGCAKDGDTSKPQPTNSLADSLGQGSKKASPHNLSSNGPNTRSAAARLRKLTGSGTDSPVEPKSSNSISQSPFDAAPIKMARLPQHHTNEVGEISRTAESGRGQESLDSPLLEGEDIGTDASTEAGSGTAGNRMLLPLWSKQTFKSPMETSEVVAVPEPASKFTEPVVNEVDTHQVAVAAGTAEETEPVKTRPAPKRRNPGSSTSAATAKKRVRRKFDSDGEYEEANEADVDGQPKAALPRRRTPAANRRITAAGAKLVPAPIGTDELAVAGNLPAFIPTSTLSSVSLLTGEYVRTIIREELTRHRELIKNEIEVTVKHIGSPPPGSQDSPNTQWSLIEDMHTGKQIYIPLDDVRKKHSRALVEYFLVAQSIEI